MVAEKDAAATERVVQQVKLDLHVLQPPLRQLQRLHLVVLLLLPVAHRVPQLVRVLLKLARDALEPVQAVKLAVLVQQAQDDSMVAPALFSVGRPVASIETRRHGIGCHRAAVRSPRTRSARGAPLG